MARRAVILIPGFLDKPRLFRTMERRLRRAGHRTAVFGLSPSTGARGMDELAAELGPFIARAFGDERVSVVGFSMGGIVARYWAQRLGGAGRTNHLITVGTPHRGTVLAWLLPLRGVRQLRPGSAFLRGLNADAEGLQLCGVASIWSPVDAMIVPPSSGRLGVGAEKRLLVPIHAWLPRSARVSREVLRLLGS